MLKGGWVTVMVLYREGTMLILKERFLASLFYLLCFHSYFFSDNKNGAMMRSFQNWNMVSTKIRLKMTAAIATQYYVLYYPRVIEFEIKSYLEGQLGSQVTCQQLKHNGKWRSFSWSKVFWLKIPFFLELLKSIVWGTDF